MLQRHLTPSLVISLVALFVALGGASYAAIRIPANSVGNKQLKKNAVTASKVKNASLLAEDFKAGQLPRGDQGPKGDTGAAGPTASAYAANDGNANGLAAGVMETVLNTGDAGGSGAMTVTTRSRLVASASVQLYKGTAQAAAVADADCVIQGAPEGGSSFDMSNVIQGTMATGAAGAAVHTTIALTGSVVVDPGTYVFRVRCQRTPGAANSNGEPTYAAGGLAVVASGL